MIPTIIGLTVEQQIQDEENAAHNQDECTEYGKEIKCENSAGP